MKKIYPKKEGLEIFKVLCYNNCRFKKEIEKMTNKNKRTKLIFGLVAIVVVASLIIQLVLNADTKRLKEEEKKYENLTVETKSGLKVETEYSSFDNSKFYLKIPTSFKQLDYDTVIKKYNGDVPDFVFSNEEATINIAISITESGMANNKIEQFKDYMVHTMAPTSIIIAEDYYKIDEHNIGQIKLISKATDTNIYNNMLFFSLKGNLVIINFNCTKDLQEEWEKVGDFIIDSLFFKK